MKFENVKAMGKVLFRIGYFILLCILFHVIYKKTVDLGDFIVCFVLVIMWGISAIIRAKWNKLRQEDE